MFIGHYKYIVFVMMICNDSKLALVTKADTTGRSVSFLVYYAIYQSPIAATHHIAVDYTPNSLPGRVFRARVSELSLCFVLTLAGE